MPESAEPTSTTCPTVDAVERHLAGDTVPGLDTHFAECASCRSLADDLALMGELKSVFDSSSPNVEGRKHFESQGGFPGYSKLTELQRGAQGIVYRATQDETQRPVALKVLLNGAFATERQRIRFQREVELAARLRHPNIVTVYDSGEYQGNLFYAMEFVDGQRLDVYACEQFAGSNPGKVARAVATIARDIASAVGHAHTAGIIHRDLKPANILVDARSVPHVLDFGLARTAEASGATHSGEFLGTLRYASPEQTRADPALIDVRTDVYSLGVILFEALTNSSPYQVEGSLDEIIRGICNSIPPAPSTLASGVDSDLDTIVLKCLAKDKLRRYQSGSELAIDLQRYLAGDPIDARRDSQWYLLTKLLRRYRYAVAAAAAVVTAIVASLVLTLSMLQQVRDERDKATTAQGEADQAREAERRRRLQVEEQQALAEFNAYAASIAASDSALRVNNTAEASLHLRRAPKSQRGFEFWYTQRRLNTSVHSFDGHTSYVEQVVALRTRPWVISIGWDQKVIVHSRDSTDQIAMRDLPSYGWSLAVNDTETLLAVGGWDGLVRIWSLPELTPLREICGPADRVMALKFEPETDRVAAGFWAFEGASQKNAFIVADARTGEVASTEYLPGRPFWISRRGSNWLCSAAKQTVVVDDNGDASEVLSYQVLACSPDSKQTAILRPGHQIELQAAGQQVSLQGHTGPIISASFNSGSNLLATCSRDHTVRVWNTRTGELVRTLVGHEWQVTSATFVPDTNQLATASWDQTVRLWDLNVPQAAQTILGHDSGILSIAISPDGDRFATGANDGTIKIWAFDNFRCIRTIQGHDKPVQDVAFSPDATRIVSASWDGTSRLHSLVNETKPIPLIGHTDLVLAAQFAPDGQTVYTGSRDNTIRVWDAASGKLTRVIEGHDDHIHTLRFHPDGSQFATAGHKSIRLWKLGGEPQRVLPRNIIQEDYSLAYHPNGKELAAGTDRLLGFWNPLTGDVQESVLASRDEMLSVAYSPDGSRLVSVSASGMVRIWDTAHRMPLMTLRDTPARVHRAVFSSDGTRVIGGLDDGRITIWHGLESTVP